MQQPKVLRKIFEPYQESNQTFLVVFSSIITVIIVCGLLMYYWFRPKAKDVTVMGPFNVMGDNGKPNPNSLKPILDQTQVHSYLGNNFTLSFFTYMNEINTERIPIAGPKGDFRFKPLIYILGVGDVIVDPIHQLARVRVKPLTKDSVFKSDVVNNVDIDNFMILKWHQLTISVEGRTVDVYLNGLIAKSMLLDNLPILNPSGVLLETSPDFSGQTCLFQAWPYRLSESQISQNYTRNTDTRGRPKVPDAGFNVLKFLEVVKESFCKVGLCEFRPKTNDLQYIDYEYA